MASPAHLYDLASRLKKATSLHEQLKVLVRGWRTVRALSPEQKVELATHVGLEQAEELLQRLGHPGGIAPSRLLAAVRKAEGAQPGELQGLLRDLGDRHKRGPAVRRWLETVDGYLDRPTGPQVERLEPDQEPSPPSTSVPVNIPLERPTTKGEVAPAPSTLQREAQKPPPGPPPPPQASGPDAEALAPVTEERQASGETRTAMAAPAAAAAAAGLAAREEARVLRRAMAEPPGVEAEEEKLPPPRPEPGKVETKSVGPARQSKPERREIPAPEPSRDEAAEDLVSPQTEKRMTEPRPPARPRIPFRARHERVEEKPTPVEGAGLIEALQAQPYLSGRFRLLRQSFQELAKVKDLAPVLESFPEGWARRRALNQLIRAGIVNSVDQALRLIESLQNPQDEFWCLSSLLDVCDLDAETLEELAGTVRSPMSRRLIRRRLGDGSPLENGRP